MDDTDIDEDKCFLLSLLPSFRQFKDEQTFLARMEILKLCDTSNCNKIWTHTHLAPCLPFLLLAFLFKRSFLPNSSHFALNLQPGTSMKNSEILSRYLSNYSVEPQRPPTSAAFLPQYPCPVSSNAPLLPGADGSSDVSSICWFYSASVSLNSFFHFSIQIL